MGRFLGWLDLIDGDYIRVRGAEPLRIPRLGNFQTFWRTFSAKPRRRVDVGLECRWNQARSGYRSNPRLRNYLENVGDLHPTARVFVLGAYPFGRLSEESVLPRKDSEDTRSKVSESPTRSL